jgi:hypothetical protein
MSEKADVRGRKNNTHEQKEQRAEKLKLTTAPTE